MKKTLLLAVALIAATASSYGQGSWLFGGATKTAWDQFSVQGTSKLGATINVALLFGSGSAAITSILPSTPTNAAVAFDNAAAWSAILTDPNFKLGTNSGTGLMVTSTTAANGSWTYNGSGSFLMAGSVANTAYNVYLIGWSSAYANPYLAAAAGGAVGWSTVFSYTPSLSPNPPPTFPAGTSAQQFGVSAAPVPEPSTLVLAGLGGLSLLAFRRKK